MINDLSNYLKIKGEEFKFSFGIQPISDIRTMKNKEYFINHLSTKEIDVFNSFTINKRRNDWLSGRLAAKKAFKYYFKEELVNNKNVSILNHSNKSPYLFEHPELNVSITHSGDYAIALISKSDVGIDLEKIVNHNELIVKYYFTSSESVVVNGCENQSVKNEIITKLWTRKEAVSKYLKLGMKINFKLLDITKNNLCLIDKNDAQIKLRSYKIDNYFLSIAV